jgi:virginiamycin B lyase
MVGVRSPVLAARAAAVLVALVAVFAPPAATAQSAQTDPQGREWGFVDRSATSRGIADGPDGNPWFTETVGDRIGSINPFGSVFEYPLPHAGSDAFGIARGPDGNVWFTERAASRIGRITPAGVVKEFPLPAGSSPQGVATGPDGNLWFAEGRQPGAIARMTPSGALTEFALPAGYSPYDVAAGGDAKVWFTNTASATASIGKLDPATGTITHYRVLSTGRIPYRITPGPDGAMWFSASPANIGRITFSGSVKLFPKTAGHIEGIVTGADGNIWYAEHDAHMLGSMTPQGVVTQYPASGNPFAIAAGPDGNIWYTTAVTNKVGMRRVVPRSERHALCRDSGCSPASLESGRGTVNRWSFYGPHVHRVADPSGMGLFDSGPKPAVSYYSTSLGAAGTYRYADPADPGFAGKVFVPVTALPFSGKTTATFTVTWAAAAPPAGRVYDVQIKRPGAADFSDWKLGTTATTAGFVPDAGVGGYTFRARMREPGSGKAIAYSQGEKISVFN